MSILTELKNVINSCGLPVETGVFSGIPPDEYAVLTPLTDDYWLHVDNAPEIEVQNVRISVFTKGNYIELKKRLCKRLLAADFTITDRRYNGHENDTGYHHYVIDAAKYYETEEL